jgi:hypothetical protein
MDASPKATQREQFGDFMNCALDTRVARYVACKSLTA